MSKISRRSTQIHGAATKYYNRNLAHLSFRRAPSSRRGEDSLATPGGGESTTRFRQTLHSRWGSRSPPHGWCHLTPQWRSRAHCRREPLSAAVQTRLSVAAGPAGSTPHRHHTSRHVILHHTHIMPSPHAPHTAPEVKVEMASEIGSCAAQGTRNPVSAHKWHVLRLAGAAFVKLTTYCSARD